MKSINTIQGAVALATLLALGACGGGGGGGDTLGDRIAGRVEVATGQRVDADLADDAPGVNNTLDTAQPLPNPGIVGGFVAAASACPDDPYDSPAAADVHDYYTVPLAAGQTVQMQIADARSDGDLRLSGCPGVGMTLELFDAQGDPVDDVTVAPGDPRTVALPVTSNGRFRVHVRADSGYSSYTLSVGVPTLAASTAQADFVPGEIVARFRQGETRRDVRRLATRALGRGIEVVGATPGGGPTLLRVTETPDGRALAAASAALQRQATMERVAALRARPDVLYALPNYRLRTDAAPSDPRYSDQWALGAISWLPVWEDTNVDGGDGTVVAVIDNGLYYDQANGNATHPDLAGQLDTTDTGNAPPPGLDLAASASVVGDWDANPDDDPAALGAGAGYFYHGTHVAGIIAAATDNGMGMAGVAWNARILPLRAIAGTTGTLADVIQAMRYAAGLPVDDRSGITPRATPVDVINMSLSAPVDCSELAPEFDEVRAQGVIIVASAGNDGTSSPVCPASAPGVVGVGATTEGGGIASYSNSGENVDLVAPGGGDAGAGVLGTNVAYSAGGESPGYREAAGTSFAAPHVAGVAALMRGLAGAALTPDVFDCAIAGGRVTNTDVVVGDGTRAGAGRIDAEAAIVYADDVGSGASSETIVARPAAPTMGTESDSLTLNLNLGCAGGDTLETLENLNPAEDAWLSIEGGGVLSGTSDSVTLSVDRNALRTVSNLLVNRATLRVTTAGLLERDITLTVIDAGATGTGAPSVGPLYALLFGGESPLTGGSAVPVAEQRLAATGGVYRFDFDGLPQGQYTLFVGTDADADQVIGDRGEATTAWRSLDDIATIDLGLRDVTGLEMAIGFQQPVTSTLRLERRDR